MRYARDLILFEDEKFTICQPIAQTFPISRGGKQFAFLRNAISAFTKYINCFFADYCIAIQRTQNDLCKPRQMQKIRKGISSKIVSRVVSLPFKCHGGKSKQSGNKELSHRRYHPLLLLGSLSIIRIFLCLPPNQLQL